MVKLIRHQQLCSTSECTAETVLEFLVLWFFRVNLAKQNADIIIEAVCRLCNRHPAAAKSPAAESRTFEPRMDVLATLQSMPALRSNA
jgi:hypothetical protein